MKIENLKNFNNLKTTGNCAKTKPKSASPQNFAQQKLDAQSFKPYFLGNLGSSFSLPKDDRITDEVLEEVDKINEQRIQNGGQSISKKALFNQLLEYENYENLDPAHQKFTLYGIEHSFGLSDKEILNLPKESSLMQFAFVSDFKQAGNRADFIQNLKEKASEIKIKPIEVSDENISKLFDENGVFSFENIKNALNGTNLNKYVYGFNLKYPRKDFIEDFNKLTSDLSEKDKNYIYNHFNFSINTRNDIIKYPTPNAEIPTEIAPNMQKKLEEANKLVNKFMLQNEVCLSPEDKELENLLNETIKIFPEFITLIGKKQHRGDSMDFHTFDDIKRVYNNPEFEKLSDKDKKILFISLLFHDFSKPEAMVDRDHPASSAEYAKEIIKKLSLSDDDNERIYNFIKHSHFATDGDSIEDIAIYFRRPNDFKMAEILGRADSASAGFDFVPSRATLNSIQEKIDAINSDGILLFNNNIPKDLKNLETAPDGTKYLDFSNPQAVVSKYGFKEGAKVQDLNFLCHASQDSPLDFANLLNGYKDVCLSTAYLNMGNGVNLQKKPKTLVILSSSNSNIVSGGKETICTGKQKSFKYLNETLYKKFGPNKADRERLSKDLKQRLNLSDKEYLELYNNQINAYASTDEIVDISLSGGKILRADKIKKEISEIQKYLTEENGAVYGYINEIVAHNPKIQAFVVEKEELLNNSSSQKILDIKKASSKFNIPIVAV